MVPTIVSTTAGIQLGLLSVPASLATHLLLMDLVALVCMTIKGFQVLYKINVLQLCSKIATLWDSSFIHKQNQYLTVHG